MILETLKTSIQNLLVTSWLFQEVLPYHKVGLNGYPSATFEVSRMQNAEFDSCDNKVTYNFSIVIQQELSLTKRKEAREILDNKTDALVDIFNNNRTLGGICTRVLVENVDFNEMVLENGNVLYAMLSVSCEILDFNQ